ncbi:MAG: prepilin-type N-terminal cleavage/methylation domain-containing protein, partial [Armatimonadetes bacterium]|nr:prepilin-type N-terminal cleavage/methylation domain-containing protein [Armatimonadota bacterium]
MKNNFQKRITRNAFSLVELLVVLAITTIILGLLFGPIISSFNLTRKARALSQAQDAARFGLERLSRDLGQATYIYDNGIAPVSIPMNYPAVPTPSGNIVIGGATANDWPRIAYGRIDVVQPAVRSSTADIIDPTTGKPVGGAELQPGVRGKRVTRYFLGLRNPRNADGSQRLYENIYEFRRADNNLNPVIMYRAEYDPTDQNLFNTTSPATYSSLTPNAAGFNDPAFFYGTATAPNGQTYGQNWQAISQAVITSENLDLLRWNRAGLPTERDRKDAVTPFSATTTFTPVAVPDDVAAPGFLTSGGVETPAAVPTLYQTKYGAWTYPYTITVLRGSTNYGGTRPDSEPFGKMILTVDRDAGGNISVTQLNAPATISGNPNTLATTAANIYSVFSPTTRTLFVKTPALTFSINPDRGRVETAFPPLYGTTATVTADGGIPFYFPAGSGVASPVPVGGVPAIGDIIPLRFVQETRDPNAGNTDPVNPSLTVPINQGITQVDLLDPINNRYT